MPKKVRDLDPDEAGQNLRFPLSDEQKQVRRSRAKRVDPMGQYAQPRRGRKGSDPEIRPGYPLGEFIRIRLQFAGLTRSQLADKVGVSESGINQIITGNTKSYPTLQTVRGIADALGVSTITLLALTPVVTDWDIRKFLIDESARKASGLDDGTWSALGSRLADLTPEQRAHVVKVLQAVLDSMGLDEKAS